MARVIKSKLKRVMISIAIIIILLFVLFVIYFYKVANPVIINYSKAKINSLTEQAVNISSSEVLRATKYENMVNIIRTSDNTIAYIEAKTNQINLIVRDIVDKTQQNVSHLMLKGLDLPIGTYSGISLFAGKGPNVKLKLVPMGVVSTEILSTFKEAGINNTLHSIYLKIKTHVNVSLPVKNYDIYCESQILLCESVIVGKVPSVYLNSQNLNEKLNLTA